MVVEAHRRSWIPEYRDKALSQDIWIHKYQYCLNLDHTFLLRMGIFSHYIMNVVHQLPTLRDPKLGAKGISTEKSFTQGVLSSQPYWQWREASGSRSRTNIRAKFNCSGLCKTFSLLRRLRRLDFASTFQPLLWTVKHCAPIKTWPQLWVLKTNKCSQRKSGLLDLTQSQLNQVLDWALRTFVLRRKKLDLPFVLCTMQTYPEGQPALQGASRLRRDGEGRGSYGHSILVAGPWTGDSIYFKSS